jgi:hypothetical protein
MEPFGRDSDDAAEALRAGDTSLALLRDKSPRSNEGCPNPRRGWALEVAGVELVPLGCGRNGCSYCGVRNVQVTATMMGLNAERSTVKPSHAVLTTTREEVDDATVREAWRQFARGVRRSLGRPVPYAWFKERTTGEAPRSGGIRRLHFHSAWSGLRDDEGAAVRDISQDVFGRLTGAYSERAHGVKRVWDTGGLTRYFAGLVGHHLKYEQSAAAEGERVRRVGTSRGYYVTDPAELRREATVVVRDERVAYRLFRAIVEAVPDGLPEHIVDEVLTERLRAVKAAGRPSCRVVPVPANWWTR